MYVQFMYYAKWEFSDYEQLQRIKMHCVKSVQIRSIFWSTFSRIRTAYGVSPRTQSECGKTRTGITPITDTFHSVMVIIVSSAIIKKATKLQDFFEFLFLLSGKIRETF